MKTPSKDQLERQKLALEIRELQRKWWQRPVYLSALLPMVLAALTVLAGILSGYFDRERAKLNSDISALKKEKDALIERTSALSNEINRSLQQLAKMHTIVVEELSKDSAEGTPTPSPPEPESHYSLLKLVHYRLTPFPFPPHPGDVSPLDRPGEQRDPHRAE